MKSCAGKTLAALALVIICGIFFQDAPGWHTSAHPAAAVGQRRGKSKRSRYQRKRQTVTRVEKKGKMEHLTTGTWGGEHIRLEVTTNGATLEFDCANGEIKQAIILDSKSCFDVPGMYTREHAGPVREGEQPNSYAARYSGCVTGNTLRLNIVLADQRRTVQAFTLALGSQPRLHKCM